MIGKIIGTAFVVIIVFGVYIMPFADSEAGDFRVYGWRDRLMTIFVFGFLFVIDIAITYGGYNLVKGIWE